MRQFHRGSWVRLSAVGLTVAGVLALAGGCATAPPPAPPQQAQLAEALSPPERATPPIELSPTVRELLKSRMANHTRDMGELVSAIMILDYPRIEERAQGIVSDVSLSRPTTNDATELNASLPEVFFERQDALRAEARALARDAKAQDARRVASDYGHLSEACVRCHADFRPNNAR
ncbi:MAG TPA: cytochrome c [Polyangia bacterium]|jgi:cytochrome c556|nr:cytochrome c [Polyangia bacterium]